MMIKNSKGPKITAIFACALSLFLMGCNNGASTTSTGPEGDNPSTNSSENISSGTASSEESSESSHTWDTENIEWTWYGYETAIAKLTCLDDSNHTREKVASITSTISIEPKCEEEGEKTYTAYVDFDDVIYTDTKTEILFATGHELIYIDAVEATCTEDGNIEYWYCEDCEKCFSDSLGDAEIKQESTVIPAKGHNLTHCDSSEATCTEDGNVEYWHCSDCDKYYSDQNCENEITSPVISAKGHNLIHTDAIAATCTEDGNIEYWYCSVCEKYFSNEDATKEITQADTITEATRDHIYGADNTCTHCGIHKPTDGLNYKHMSYGGYYLTSRGQSADSEIYIADTYDDGSHGKLPVIGIEDRAFWEDTTITSVAIPDTVTSIGYSAFDGCTALASVNIPDNVTIIEGCAFRSCSSLTSINIPDSLTSLGALSFKDCSLLESATLGNSVASIKNDTFNGCTSLASINIPDSVTSIGNFAFSNCETLDTIVIPDSVTSIGKYTFNECDALKSITLGSNLTSIGLYAFNYCSALTSAVFKNSDGWYVSTDSEATSGTNVDLSSSSTNAAYLKSKYLKYYWFRS